ncbi:MAG: Gfo/Idh/MocA family oxidoreductase [Planctomycetota bacterium]
MPDPTPDDDALKGKAAEKTGSAPDLPYRPPMPRAYRPRIALVGCGGISEQHLTAYRNAGWDVAAIVARRIEAAGEKRDAFYPSSAVYTDLDAVLSRDDIGVVDITLHPEPRAPMIEAALNAGKHVLSQKPFATDLETAERLVKLADERGVKLAVNQNGRFAPHVAYTRAAIDQGLLGSVGSIDLAVHWDHNWVADTPFNDIPHLLLYDFGIHWFDMVRCYLGDRRVNTVCAHTQRLAGQQARPALGGHAILHADDAVATLSFNGNTTAGPMDRTLVVGTGASVHSIGPDLNEQQLTLYRGDEVLHANLEGRWFPDGFAGTMGGLLCAIEEDREPTNSAGHNLHSLEIAFAAIASAEAGGQPIEVGSVRRVEPQWIREGR